MGQYLSCISLTSLLMHQQNLIGFLFLCWCTTSLEIHFFYSGFTPIFLFQLAWHTMTNYCGEDRLWITTLSDSKAGNKLQYMESVLTVYQRITFFYWPSLGARVLLKPSFPARPASFSFCPLSSRNLYVMWSCVYLCACCAQCRMVVFMWRHLLL